MRRYWLMDQHGADGPTALVETDGRLHIVDVLRFGPSVTELEDQQKVWDEIVDRVAPTLKPLVDAASIDEEGIAPHPDLRLWKDGGSGPTSQSGRVGGGIGARSAGRTGGGAHRNRSRGDR